MDPQSNSSSSGRGDGISKFSLLGQQLTRYSSSVAQHQGQSLQQGASSRGGFSLVHSLPQNHGATHPQMGNSSHSRSNGNGGIGRSFSNVQHQQQPPYNLMYGTHDLNQSKFEENSGSNENPPQGGSTQVLLSTLSVLQQKIQQLQSIVQLIAQEDSQSGQPSTAMARQQVVTAGVTSIISQLMVAAAGMLPSSQQQLGVNLVAMTNPADHQLGPRAGVGPGLGSNALQQNVPGNSSAGTGSGPGGANNFFGHQGGFGEPITGGFMASLRSLPPQTSLGSSNSPNMLGTSLNAGPSNVKKTLVGATDASHCQTGSGTTNQSGDSQFTGQGSGGADGSTDDNDIGGSVRDEDDDGEGENLPPGSYHLVEMDAVEILAEHTHFCDICGKGFKRDANLRMHMRGHGDEYKTPAALARPEKAQDSAPVQPRRYSCPFVGCKRNKKHKKFQPLKTMLCVKNHYRRSHCPKMYTCNRCKSKKFSVVADLKTHEKHCGRDKWQCSCGTTFSRKDKLFGHIALFQGHTPAFPPNETEGVTSTTDQGGHGGITNNISNSGSAFANSCGNVSQILGGPDVVNSNYSNGDLTCVDPGANSAVMETTNRAVHGQIGVKSIDFSEEGHGQNIGVDSLNPVSGFSTGASTLMGGPFMFHISNSFHKQNGGN